MQPFNNSQFTYFKRKTKPPVAERQSKEMKQRYTSHCTDELLIYYQNTAAKVYTNVYLKLLETIERFLPDRLNVEQSFGSKLRIYDQCIATTQQVHVRDSSIPNTNYGFRIKSNSFRPHRANQPPPGEEMCPSSCLLDRDYLEHNDISRNYGSLSSSSPNDMTTKKWVGEKSKMGRTSSPPKTSEKIEFLATPSVKQNPLTTLLPSLRPTSLPQRSHITTARLMISLLLLCPAVAAARGQRHSGSSTYNDEVVVSGYSEVAAAPYFLSPGNRNITTTHGQTAYLHCRVASLGDMAHVSWIRKRDLHVLSSGRMVFASDQRFQVINTDDKSENWTLQIKFAQLRDSGIYECQVNTVPKISMAYQLNVVESEAVIHGPEYVKAGSTISLTCTIHKNHMEGGLVFWYHNTEMLKYEDQGNVNILTKEDQTGLTTSQLTIRGAQLAHSGNYTCWPTLAKPKAVIVNVVLQGEQPAAMQTGVANQHHASTVALLMPMSYVLIAEILFRGTLLVNCFSGCRHPSRNVLATKR